MSQRRKNDLTDLTGIPFKAGVVVARAGISKHRSILWLLRCQVCGHECLRTRTALRKQTGCEGACANGRLRYTSTMKVFGLVLTLKQIASVANVEMQTIRTRLRSGATPEEAILRPKQRREPRIHKKYLLSDGRLLTKREMEKVSGLNRSTLERRIKNGMTLDEAMRLPGKVGRPRL